MSGFTRYWQLYEQIHGEVNAIGGEISKGNKEALEAKLSLIDQLNAEFHVEARSVDALDVETRARFDPSRLSVTDWVTKLRSLILSALGKWEPQVGGPQAELRQVDASQAGPSQEMAEHDDSQKEKTLVPGNQDQPSEPGDSVSEESEFRGFSSPLRVDSLGTSNFLQNLIDEMEKSKPHKGHIAKLEKQGSTGKSHDASGHPIVPVQVDKPKSKETMAQEVGPSQRPPAELPSVPQVPPHNPLIPPHMFHQEQGPDYVQPVHYEEGGAHGYSPHYVVPNPQPYFPPQFRMQVENVIRIPHFDGRRLDQWVPFRAAFTRFIHLNPTLDNLSKLSQLLQHVTGEALETINGFPFQENQYANAWAVLNKRYNREDRIIDDAISRLMHLPSLRGNITAEKLSTIVNVTNQMLRTLPTFGIDVTSWDPILKHILISKFDEETRSDWKVHIGTNQRVPLNTLLDFLEVRMFTVGRPEQGGQHLRAGQGGQHVRAGQGGQQPRQRGPQGIHVVEERAEEPEYPDGRCVKCGRHHFIYNCPVLRRLTAKERFEEIKKLRLCFKCLKRHPGSKDDCHFGNCPICQGPHNAFICFTKERRDRERKKGASQEKRDTKEDVNHA